MYKFHQMVHSDKKDSDTMFKELLCQLIYYISTFFIENKDIIDQKFGTSFCCHDYESLNTNKISGHYRNALKKAVKELKEIKIMYETQDFYISRPMQGISPKDADVYDTVLSDMVKVAEKKSFRCFYGKKFSEQDTLGIYLEASSEIILSRIRNRGRGFERNISEDFVKKQLDLYDDWLLSIQKQWSCDIININVNTLTPQAISRIILGDI